MKVSKYEVLAPLPDPFLFKDGRRVTSREDWQARRAEMYDDVITLQYGHQPPQPEFLETQTLYVNAWGKRKILCYRITTGRREHPVSFVMYVHLPDDYKGGKVPVAVDGDLCFGFTFEGEHIRQYTQNGIALVLFNRTELACDDARGKPREEGRVGPMFECYPEYDFGALGAWAWGYSRCVDALEKLGLADERCIAFTGCSRGAKTAMLAGVLDERATIVNPVETNAGSCACYRIHSAGITYEGTEMRSETLADIWQNYPFWFGPDLGAYKDDETALPFDCHFLKAMIAPRTLLVSEAENDMWGNSPGSYQTSLAAKEVWKLFGCPEKMLWYWRQGDHGHNAEDHGMLVNLMRHHMEGVPLNENFYRVLFDKPEPIFDWSCPTEE